MEAKKVTLFLAFCCLLPLVEPKTLTFVDIIYRLRGVPSPSEKIPGWIDYVGLSNKDALPKDMVLNETALFNEVLNNPAKYNAVLNSTAPNDDPAAKIVSLNETAVWDEIISNPAKFASATTNQYNSLQNDAAMKKSDTTEYNIIL